MTSNTSRTAADSAGTHRADGDDESTAGIPGRLMAWHANWQGLTAGERKESANLLEAEELTRLIGPDERAAIISKFGARGYRAIQAAELAAYDPEGARSNQASKTVLDAIAPDHDNDRKDVRSAYSRLLEPLPLLGGDADPDAVHAALSEMFPWMVEANEALCEGIALSRIGANRWLRFPPILLAGAPGTGKTRWASEAARICGLPIFAASAIGLTTSAFIFGDERVWKQAKPSGVVLAMARLDAANPIVLLDEIDKAPTSDHHGNALESMLAALERHSAKKIFDLHLQGHVDMSEINWVMTANKVHELSSPFLSRVRIVFVDSPGAQHFERLTASVLKDIRQDYDIPEANMPDLSESIDDIRRGIGKTFSPRAVRADLERALRRAVWTPNRTPPEAKAAQPKRSSVLTLVPTVRPPGPASEPNGRAPSPNAASISLSKPRI